MQTCALCNASSPDQAHQCTNCGADLPKHSTTALALECFRKNPRVRSIRLIVWDDACPACKAAEGSYAKADVPALPIPGCSHSHGCRCFYEPFLTDIHP